MAESTASDLVSNITHKRNTVFPATKETPIPMAQDVKNQFHRITGMTEEFMAALESRCFVTPSVIINNFGHKARYIASTFGKVGPKYLKSIEGRKLVLFSRLQLGLATELSTFSDKKWKSVKKRSKFREEFLAITEEKISDFLDEFHEEEALSRLSLLIFDVMLHLKEFLANPDPLSVQTTTASVGGAMAASLKIEPDEEFPPDPDIPTYVSTRPSPSRETPITTIQGINLAVQEELA